MRGTEAAVASPSAGTMAVDGDKDDFDEDDDDEEDEEDDDDDEDADEEEEEAEGSGTGRYGGTSGSSIASCGDIVSAASGARLPKAGAGRMSQMPVTQSGVNNNRHQKSGVERHFS